MVRPHFLIASFILLGTALHGEDALDELPLSQIQVIGTHNSYHIAPDEVAAKVLGTITPKEAEAVDYSLPPLTEQLQRIGVRQLELDLFLDPDGKLFASPTMLTLAKTRGVKVPPHDPDGLLQ